MTDRPEHLDRPRSSRQRYRAFVDDYQQRRLDDLAEAAKNGKPADDPAKLDPPAPEPKGKRRAYLREYLRWLWPHRYAVGAVFLLALVVAGLEMVEPLFMRYIVDRVLLNTQLPCSSR
jgi:ATP-binding cassette subfamily B protein